MLRSALQKTMQKSLVLTGSAIDCLHSSFNSETTTTIIESFAMMADMHTNHQDRFAFGSLTRTSDLETKPFYVRPYDREYWASGDYIVGRFLCDQGAPLFSDNYYIELTNGRRRKLNPDDLVVGALGDRLSTKESVGLWKEIREDNHMQDLANSGLFGFETSHSITEPTQPTYMYMGHVLRNGRKVCMKDFAPMLPEGKEALSWSCPTILVIGTCMSAGKTTVARTIINQLRKECINTIVGAKLTGVGHFNDILSMRDAGATATFDFVDAGIPSTVLPKDEYAKSLQRLLSLIASQNPDVVVIEAGASPIEYNGKTALQHIAAKADLVVLCASDPFSVIGADQVFKQLGLDIKPDLVCGAVANTSAGCALVMKETGIPTMDLTSEKAVKELRKLMKDVIVKQPSYML